MMSERHDAVVLLAVLREDWAEFDRLLEHGTPDPAAFAQLAQSCDVQPWVHALLEREQRLARFGPGLAPIFDRARSKVRADNLLLLARAEQALDLLLAAGIRPVALKGLEVLHRFYTAFDQRRLDDVDLLVPPDQVQRACEVLADAGLHLDVVAHLQRAKRLILKASQTRSRFERRILVRKAVRQQEAARGLLVDEGLGEET